MVGLLFTTGTMSPRAEFAVIMAPWLALILGLLVFSCWRDAQPLPARDAQPLPAPAAQVAVR